jgi:hypothetical protein
MRTRASVQGALLATPPLFADPIGPEYPTVPDFEREGWLLLPRPPLPFRSVVAASPNDPLGA